mgnify:CR=1 FL=1
MIADTNEIAIRSIQHYIYCPHRWGLIEVGRVWSENAFVVKANIMHKRVHDNENSYVPQKGKKVHTAVKVYNDKPEYGIYGVTDCIETDEKNNICNWIPGKWWGRESCICPNKFLGEKK